MKKYMPLEGLRWSRDSGSTLCDTPQNGRSRTGWGGFWTFLKHKDKKQKAWNHDCDSKLFSLISLGGSLMQLISLRVKPHAVLRPYEPLLRLPRSRRASRIPE